MTLKEELEILRGEPIQVFTGDPMDIPCIETSDPERLCKKPVVSVNMITYNHEPYIRQAIEGVMMQKTDFEFELVIGEDCSTDKTREICFEYQKKYPDKIRVLWWHENLRKVNHPAGCNYARNAAHLRGEYVALCEGDDYWIDPLKLQKQVDVMRKHPNVTFCFCGAQILDQKTGVFETWNESGLGFEPGLIPSEQYTLWTMFGRNPLVGWGDEFWQMTATFLLRRSVLDVVKKQLDIFNWKLSVGDVILCLGCASRGDTYYIGDNVAVYRRTDSGVTVASRGKCGVDTLIARIYFARKVLNLEYCDLPDTFVERCIMGACSYVSETKGRHALREYLLGLETHPRLAAMVNRSILYFQHALRFEPGRLRLFGRWIYYYGAFIIGHRISRKLQSVYLRWPCDCRLRKCCYRLGLITYLKKRLTRSFA